MCAQSSTMRGADWVSPCVLPNPASGSDTGVYDSEGRFVPQKFEEIFSKYDKDNKGGLTYKVRATPPDGGSHHVYSGGLVIARSPGHFAKSPGL